MSGKYVKGTQKVMGGNIDLVNEPLLVMLIDSSLYTYDLVNDESLSQIPASSIIAESTLDGRALIGTALQASSTAFTDPEAGRDADTLVIAVAGTTFDNSYLVAAIDFTPYVTDGSDSIVEWENSLVLGY